MQSIEGLLESANTWQERDDLLRDEYERLQDSPNRDNLVETFVQGLLQRIIRLSTASDRALPLIPNGIRNFQQNSLSSFNNYGAGTVRSVRFKDGLFFSVRLKHAYDVIQHDLAFYHDGPEPERPRISSQVLRDYGNGELIRSVLRSNFQSHDSELYDEPVPDLVMNAHRIIDSEASHNPPWPNAYSTFEVKAARRWRHVVYVNPHDPNVTHRSDDPDIRYIGFNAELNEPYL